MLISFFQIIIIIIMVAIVTGIIIDTFSEMRSQKAAIDDNQNNVCFVCSIQREKFERKNIKFADHVECEHNPWSYMYYKVTGCLQTSKY